MHRLVDDTALATPDPLRKTRPPLAGVPCRDCLPQPELHLLLLVRELGWTYTRGGSPSLGVTSEAWAILVVSKGFQRTGSAALRHRDRRRPDLAECASISDCHEIAPVASVPCVKYFRDSLMHDDSYLADDRNKLDVPCQQRPGCPTIELGGLRRAGQLSAGAEGHDREGRAVVREEVLAVHGRRAGEPAAALALVPF